MHYQLTLRVLGVLLMLFNIAQIPPIAVSFYYDDGAHRAFISAFFILLACGFLLWVPFYRVKG